MMKLLESEMKVKSQQFSSFQNETNSDFLVPAAPERIISMGVAATCDPLESLHKLDGSDVCQSDTSECVV